MGRREHEGTLLVVHAQLLTFDHRGAPASSRKRGTARTSTADMDDFGASRRSRRSLPTIVGRFGAGAVARLATFHGDALALSAASMLVTAGASSPTNPLEIDSEQGEEPSWR